MIPERPPTRPSTEVPKGIPIDWLTVFVVVILGLCCVGHFWGGR